MSFWERETQRQADKGLDIHGAPLNEWTRPLKSATYRDMSDALAAIVALCDNAPCTETPDCLACRIRAVADLRAAS